MLSNSSSQKNTSTSRSLGIKLLQGLLLLSVVAAGVSSLVLTPSFKIFAATESIAKPNLVVTKIETKPAKPEPNKPFDIYVVVKNTGQSRIAALTRVELELLMGSTVSTSSAIRPLIPGKETVFIIKNRRSDLTSKEVRVAVDPKNMIAETNETDNSLITTIASSSATPTPAPISSSSANLVVSKLEVIPATPKFKEPFTVKATIKNIGTKATSPYEVPYKTTLQLDNGSSVRESYVSLLPNQELTYTYTSLKSVSVYADVKVTVDADNKVKESNENDNMSKVTIVHKLPPTPTPAPTATPTPVPSGTPTMIYDSDIQVTQMVMEAYPDPTDPAYYRYTIEGYVRNTSKLPVNKVQMTSTFESWYESALKPKLLNLEVFTLPKNLAYDGVNDLNLLDMSQPRELEAVTTTKYNGNYVVVRFDIKVKRYTSDVTVKNLVTFRGWSDIANKGVYNQSLMPITIPALGK